MAAPPSKSGMVLGDMKQMLNKATIENPVSCSFGLGPDPWALLMMHKTKAPPAVEKELTGAFPDAKNTRRGTVVIDPEKPNVVKFIITKPVSAMAKRLVKTLKGTGYNKVEILLEDGTVIEGASDEDEAAAAVGGGEAAAAPPPPAGTSPTAPPAPPSPAAAAPAHDPAELQRQLAALVPRIVPAAGSNAELLAQFKKFATDATVNIKTSNLTYAAAAISQLRIALDKVAPAGSAPPPPGPPPSPAQPAHDAAELQRRLAALIPRIGPAAGSNAELLTQLKKFATDATVNIKTSNLTYAAAAISQLEIALGKAAPNGSAAPAAAAPASGGAAIYDKSRQAWIAAHQKFTTDIQKLGAALVSTYQGEGIGADVQKRYQEVVAPLLTTFDASLADKLGEATKATDPALRTQLVGEARAIMTRYTAALANPVITDLDSNPFVPLSIQQTLSATLSGLSAAIR